MIGNHVAEVYNEFTELAGLGQGEAAADEPKGILNRFIDIVSGIFTPVINVLMAAGMIKGFLALLTTFNVLDKASGTYLILNATGDGLFYFFPLFLGYTASKIWWKTVYRHGDWSSIGLSNHRCGQWW